MVKSSDALWEELRAAGEAEHDRFWCMPVDKEFGFQIYLSNADLQNVNDFHFTASCDTNLAFDIDGWQTSGKLHSCTFPESLC